MSGLSIASGVNDTEMKIFPYAGLATTFEQNSGGGGKTPTLRGNSSFLDIFSIVICTGSNAKTDSVLCVEGVWAISQLS